MNREQINRSALINQYFLPALPSLESIMDTLLKLLLNKKSSEIRRDIFLKTKGCSRTMKRPYLYGTSFAALKSIMATLWKFCHCGHFQFCTLQTVPKLAAESRQLVEANAIHRSLKTACLDEINVVAGFLGYYTQLWLHSTNDQLNRKLRICHFISKFLPFYALLTAWIGPWYEASVAQNNICF